MKKYVLIGVGGILGAICRYLIKGIHSYPYHGSLPLNTLFINVSGSFVLALVLTAAFEVWEFDPAIRIGVTAGFLGAFTTFSTFCKETFGLIYERNYFSAVLYIVLSTLLGLAAVYFGIILVRKSALKLAKKENEELCDNITEEIKGGAE